MRVVRVSIIHDFRDRGGPPVGRIDIPVQDAALEVADQTIGLSGRMRHRRPEVGQRDLDRLQRSGGNPSGELTRKACRHRCQVRPRQLELMHDGSIRTRGDPERGPDGRGRQRGGLGAERPDIVRDHDVLALEHRRRQRQFPVAAQLAREAAEQVQVLGFGYHLQPGRVDEALVGGQGCEVAAGQENEVAVWRGRGRIRIDEVPGRGHRRANMRRVVRPEGQVLASLIRIVGSANGRAVADQDRILVPVLDVEEHVLPVGVQIAESVNRTDAVGLPAALVGPPRLRADAATLVRLLQNDINDTGDRIGSIQGRGAVLHHLDVLDGSKRQRRQVHEAALAIVPQRIGRHPLAIDQHQRCTHRQAAQRDAAGSCRKRPRKALRQSALIVGGDAVKHLGYGGVSGLLHLVCRDHLHRARRLSVGAPDRRARHLDLLHRLSLRHLLCPGRYGTRKQ